MGCPRLSLLQQLFEAQPGDPTGNDRQLFNPSDGGVDITLRDPSDQSAFRQHRQQDEAPQRARQPDGIEPAEDAPLTIDPVPQRRLIRLGGVDLSI